MASTTNFPILSKPPPSSSSLLPPTSTKLKSFSLRNSSPLTLSYGISRASLRIDETRGRRGPCVGRLQKKHSSIVAVVKTKPEPLRVMISGAPASGKGTQCELITKKYGLVHIAAGDLLRAEVAAGSENGKRAKEHMENGMLVPNEIVVMMVKERLLQPDSEESGWLLDGYPRSYSQAKALEDLNIRPDLFILLDVPEEILVERVIGRRLDPVTGRIYHLKYSPPETEEIAARLTQRFDDTEEKVKLRLKTHNQNVEAVLSIYADVTTKINGNASVEEVFAQIDNALTELVERKNTVSESVEASV